VDLSHPSAEFNLSFEPISYLISSSAYVVVMTRYNNQTYRVDAIAWNLSPQSVFIRRRTGDKTTFAEYYVKQYNRTIRNLTQPLLVHYAKRKKKGREATEHESSVGEEEKDFIYLIPELCSMTGLTQDMRTNFASKPSQVLSLLSSILSSHLSHSSLFQPCKRSPITLESLLLLVQGNWKPSQTSCVPTPQRNRN
jgi:hypothetical protein